MQIGPNVGEGLKGLLDEKGLCKYHDPETLLCTNYENRPSDCRTWPGDVVCPFTDCPYGTRRR